MFYVVMSKEIVERIDSQQLADALSTRYLSYAVSTIVSRALPDVRDGLKPVHRRIHVKSGLILYGKNHLHRRRYTGSARPSCSGIKSHI